MLPISFDATKGETIYNGLERAGAIGPKPVFEAGRQVAGSPQLMRQPNWFDRLGSAGMGFADRVLGIGLPNIGLGMVGRRSANFPAQPPKERQTYVPSRGSIMGLGMVGRGAPAEFYPQRPLPGPVKRFMDRAREILPSTEKQKAKGVKGYQF